MAGKLDSKEILTIEEAADYLSLGRRSDYKGISPHP
jgi:hypothetical protein